MTLPAGVLHITHRLGGGVARHIGDLARLLEADGVQSFSARPDTADSDAVVIARLVDGHDADPVCRIELRSPKDAATALRTAGIDHLHVHSLVGYADKWLDAWPTIARHAELAYDFTVHDYVPICPRVTMVDAGLTFCDSRSVRYCQRCVDLSGSPAGRVDVAAWRDCYAGFLAGARRRFVPDEDVAERLAPYFAPDTAFVVRPHPEPPATAVAPAPSRSASGAVRKILILGDLAPYKGSRVVRALAMDAFLRDLPLHFTVRGSIDQPQVGRLPTITLAGAYRDDDIDRILAADRPDLLLFPSVWPETYSYTLSIALRNRIFPVCFDIGAPARRVRHAGFGRVLPYELVFDPRKLNDLLTTMEIAAAPATFSGGDGRAWPGTAAYYGFV